MSGDVICHDSFLDVSGRFRSSRSRLDPSLTPSVQWSLILEDGVAFAKLLPSLRQNMSLFSSSAILYLVEIIWFGYGTQLFLLQLEELRRTHFGAKRHLRGAPYPFLSKVFGFIVLSSLVDYSMFIYEMKKDDTQHKRDEFDLMGMTTCMHGDSSES
jgi:hypothetical protein